ncbi:ankyrin repeat-containing domain protein [Mycena galopus ATCC 62051]|nr:ankyrin repeat-containing domain protein [Mycena galopus ATCC 62051]
MLIGRTDIQDALKKLNDLIGAEQSMGVANIVVLSQKILDHVHNLIQVDKNEAIILANLKNDLQNAMQLTKDMMQQLNNLNISLANANEHFRDLNHQFLDNKVHNWLKAPDAQINHNTARDLHEDNTGGWLLRSFEYKSWKSTPSSLFWINGKPGAGKTIICSTVIEDLLAIPGSVVAYFYFHYGDTDKSLRGMLSSFIIQLEEQLLNTASPLLALYQKHGSGTHEPSIEELTTCVKDLVIAFATCPIFIVLDALDEFSKPDKLEPLFRALLHSVDSHMHIFVTSRPEDAVIHFLCPLVTHELDLSSVIQDDIALYLDHILKTEHPFDAWKKVHHERVHQHLLEHSGGMFRWVTCQLDELRKCLVRDIQATLNNLPATLDATYERILSRIHGPNKDHACRLFNWLAFSFRPLHIEELSQVLAIKFTSNSSATFEEDYIEPDPKQAILRVCLSLVHITPDETLQFAHFSVKEFFMSEGIQSMPSVTLFRIEAQMAHTIIAASCLAYWLWLGSMDNILGVDIKEITKKYPLANYSRYFDFHAQFNGVSDMVEDMIDSLFKEDSHQWACWIFHREGFYGHGENTAPPLCWAAKFGFLGNTKRQLNWGANVNVQGGHYGTALQGASYRGHLNVAQLLLEYGADVNLQGGHYGTALRGASCEGRLDVAQLLLEHGADVNLQGRLYGTALQGASCEGHLNVAQLLLEHGADVNLQSEHYGTALQGASCKGHLNIAQLLLEHGADVNLQSRFYGTALQGASCKGHLDVAQLLLEHGADVNLQSTLYGTALRGASCEGHLDVAQLLLEHGADVNLQGRHYGTALQGASCEGHLDVAQLLLEHGADVNLQGGLYGTALQGASCEGHLNVAQLLLEHGADVNLLGGPYGTVLQAASYKGCLDVPQLLLEHDADVNLQDGPYGTPL